MPVPVPVPVSGPSWQWLQQQRCVMVVGCMCARQRVPLAPEGKTVPRTAALVAYAVVRMMVRVVGTVQVVGSGRRHAGARVHAGALGPAPGDDASRHW
jgi:hypothetical protein